MKITQQIRELIDHKDIDVQAAQMLMLTAQMEILENQEEQSESLASHTERLNQLELHHQRYPSATWLWAYRRKEVIAVVLIIFFIYTLIFSPWNISDFRHALLEWIGLPVDMGVDMGSVGPIIGG